MTSPWRWSTWGVWVVSRTVLFLNIVVGHTYPDRVFWNYGTWTVGGHLVPYRDFHPEYPPLAMVLFMIPGAAKDWLSYAIGFALVMLVVDVATIWLVRVAAERMHLCRDGWRAAFTYVVMTATIGAILPKFDLLPGMLTLLAVFLLVEKRDVTAWIALAAATLLKGYDLVLVPIFLLYRYQTQGGRDWWRGPLSGVLTSAAIVAPFLALAGVQGLIKGQLYHVSRGLEIESVYSSIVLLAHAMFNLPVGVSPQHETISRDVFSALNGLLLTWLPVVLVLSLGATYVVAWTRLRRNPTPDALLALSMAASAAFMIAFKALPTHYLLWLVPMGAVAFSGRVRGAYVGAALWIAAILGGAIPIVWVPLRALQTLPILVMVGRNVAIVATFILLLRFSWPAQPARDRLRHRAQSHLPAAFSVARR